MQRTSKKPTSATRNVFPDSRILPVNHERGPDTGRNEPLQSGWPALTLAVAESAVWGSRPALRRLDHSNLP